MKIGVCKLCRQGKNLRDSHVVPRAVFRQMLGGAHYGIMLDSNRNKVIKSQDQWSMHMLCIGCEDKLNKRYEKYSLSVLRGMSKITKIQQKKDYIQIVNVDQKRIILFILSVLWRALESNHEIYNELKKLNVGELIRDTLRQSIFFNLLPKTNFFTIKISNLVTSAKEYESLDLKFISNFSFRADENGFVIFMCLMEGYCFEIFFHTTSNQRLTGLGILKSNKTILKIPRVEAFSIPELRNYLVKMIEASHNKD